MAKTKEKYLRFFVKYSIRHSPIPSSSVPSRNAGLHPRHWHQKLGGDETLINMIIYDTDLIHLIMTKNKITLFVSM